MTVTERGWRRCWIYQQERFPLVAHGPLILAFSLCAVCYSSLLRGVEAFPVWPVLTVAFFSSLISFLHLRLADEFKDLEEDTRYRPYRAVPRGLVSLRELGWVWVLTGLIQGGLAIWLDLRLLPLLMLTWIYLGLMSREFFCKSWLKAHPFTYMWTHMFIMPLIDFYATACDWLLASGKPPGWLIWFVVVSFLNGFIIEIGRKIRGPEEEETGVETYSVLWGRSRAVKYWLLAMGLTAAATMVAAQHIQFFLPVAMVLGALLVVSVGVGARFLADPRSGKAFEVISGVWTLVLYLMLGIIPLGWRMLT
ncbi:MAG: UbiA family prenyltransferase [Terrimicrobiaceae bacterium]